jgi:hypothetical protein
LNQYLGGITKTVRRHWFAIAVPVLLLGTCASMFHFDYEETVEPLMTLRDAGVRAYELELKKTVTISGNMHGPSNPFEAPNVEKSADYIYLDVASGFIPASNIVFTGSRGCTESLYWQSNMEGSVTVRGDTVVVDLRMPRYVGNSETPSEHLPWEHNGTYKLLRRTDQSVLRTTSDCERH